MVAGSHLEISRSRERCLRGGRRCVYLRFAPRPRRRRRRRLRLPLLLLPISRYRRRSSPAPGAAAEPPPRPCREGGGIRTVRWPQQALAAVPSVSMGLRGGPGRGGQRPGACARQADLPRVCEACNGSRGQASRSCPARPCPGAGGPEAALGQGAAGTGISYCKCSRVSVMKAAVNRRLEDEDAVASLKVILRA